MTRLPILIMTTVLILGACGEPTTKANVERSVESSIKDSAKTETPKMSQAKPMNLIWEDLMPVGEEALLAEMYTDYYEELENRMLANSQTLTEAAGNTSEFDINNIVEGGADDTMDQIGTFNVVSSLNEVDIRIPGYVVPLDFNAANEYKEFLLVPYFGACLHTPPPPPNQIIFVTANPAVKVPDIQEPFWLEGRMSTGKFTSDLASTAYEVQLSKLEAYDY